MSPVIHIAKSGAKAAPTLPVDAVTRTFGIFGMKDSGKTTTARVLVEGICKTAGHVIVFDPVGVWWGATRAGEGPGIPGVVIGGEHGDVPLEETGGKLVAELALARQYKLVVVDLKLLRKGAAQRFLADCLEELYFRNRAPLNVVFEEADRALPQNPRGMDPWRVLGASEDIVKLGRSRGLGCTLISQRLATVNKNVTEQIESLILLRLIGPNDRKAAKAWIESNGDPTVTDRILNSMASLHQGEGWLYSPGWLRVLEKVRIRASRTLDSSATPTNEQAAEQEAAKRAPVSLDDLRDQMAATIERAKENDPKELHARIDELERELSDLHLHGEKAEPEKIIVPDRELIAELSEHVASLAAGGEEFERQRERLRMTVSELDGMLCDAGDTTKAAGVVLADARSYLDVAGALPSEGLTPATIAREAAERHVPAKPTGGALPVMPMQPQTSNGRVSGPQQRILDTIAWFDSIGVPAPRRAPLAMMAGVSSKSSGYRANLSALSSSGLITYPDGGRVTYTDAGRAQAQEPSTPGSEQELQEGILRMVSGPQAAILRALIAVYPRGLERELLAERAGVSPASSGFRANVSTLSSLELVCYPQNGYVAATELLFVRR